ncbi:MAG: c-type cytochrome [Parvularculaceae bacterium]
MNDPLFGNKIAAAVLVALLLLFGLPILTETLFGGHGEAGHDGEIKLAYPIAFEPEGGVEEAAAAGPDLGTLLANASASAGERRSALCKSCHTFEKGGADKTGPNLWGVVGRPVAGHEGFNYTGALKEFGGVWTYERLDAFLENSQALVPGGGMAQRIGKAEQRADFLAYLQTLSDDAPVPFPEPAALAPAEEEGGDAASDAESDASETASEN